MACQAVSSISRFQFCPASPEVDGWFGQFCPAWAEVVDRVAALIREIVFRYFYEYLVGSAIFAVCAGLATATFVYPAGTSLPGCWGCLDLHLAVLDAAGSDPVGVGWWRVLIILASAAGIAWAAATMLGMPLAARPIDDGKATPP